MYACGGGHPCDISCALNIYIFWYFAKMIGFYDTSVIVNRPVAIGRPPALCECVYACVYRRLACGVCVLLPTSCERRHRSAYPSTTRARRNAHAATVIRTFTHISICATVFISGHYHRDLFCVTRYRYRFALSLTV